MQRRFVFDHPIYVHTAADILQCKRRTVLRLIERKQLRATRIGRRKWLIEPQIIFYFSTCWPEASW